MRSAGSRPPWSAPRSAGSCVSSWAARRPELVAELVLLDAPLPDHDWSQEIERYDEHEAELLKVGEWRAAAELNADFWLSEVAGPELRRRVIEMQERAFELQSESEAEEATPEHEPVDLGSVRARTLVGGDPGR